MKNLEEVSLTSSMELYNKANTWVINMDHYKNFRKKLETFPTKKEA